MKKFVMVSMLAGLTFASATLHAQEDKSKRPSPPATVKETTASGNTITIDYSQPAVKGRTIGTDIAPYGKVWRTGANEATTIEITKDAKIQGKNALPKGKYSIYSIPGEKSWVFIFNKTWNQWGTNYTEADDALRVTVTPSKSPSFTERMTFTIGKDGKVTLLWGDVAAAFTVK